MMIETTRIIFQNLGGSILMLTKLDEWRNKKRRYFSGDISTRHVVQTPLPAFSFLLISNMFLPKIE